ncbi:hypothetical protein ANO11243_075400 [Dothideomycetidae sp. 11243]|nr:hypothetical protein ANO11243_075400 [fungal sp. No.11243]
MGGGLMELVQRGVGEKSCTSSMGGAAPHLTQLKDDKLICVLLLYYCFEHNSKDIHRICGQTSFVK